LYTIAQSTSFFFHIATFHTPDYTLTWGLKALTYFYSACVTLARVAATEEVDGIRNEKDPGGPEEQMGHYTTSTSGRCGGPLHSSAVNNSYSYDVCKTRETHLKGTELECRNPHPHPPSTSTRTLTRTVRVM
jgi:hypothetical protein